eukprot:CAMPEP_0206227868 /NCGR_PEP_ID=MMETSP0047_2-20121206/8859_1 /ASSEMBLY_ACC=CAM_ASM_000192 /TAXON_ID=195065 /ORGANISM="Chroomonas mesostigmatica_cf, Strain CCMP1168" /LENGTH=603 /DNA_ID=CAMNT_0053651061 /DNA_START=24 /DNA_END=1833 /DNA_ORIENTATION=+
MGKTLSRHAHKGPEPEPVRSDYIAPMSAELIEEIERLHPDLVRASDEDPLMINVTRFGLYVATLLTQQDSADLATLHRTFTYDIHFVSPPDDDECAPSKDNALIKDMNQNEQFALWHVLMLFIRDNPCKDQDITKKALSGIRKVRDKHFSEVDEEETIALRKKYGGEDWHPTEELLNLKEAELERHGVRKAFDDKLNEFLPSSDELSSLSKSKKEAAVQAQSAIEVARQRVKEFLDNPWRAIPRKVFAMKHGDRYTITDTFFLRALPMALLHIPKTVGGVVTKLQGNLKPRAFKKAQAEALMYLCESMARHVDSKIAGMFTSIVERGEERTLLLLTGGPEAVGFAEEDDREKVMRVKQTTKDALAKTVEKVRQGAAAFSSGAQPQALPHSAKNSPQAEAETIEVPPATTPPVHKAGVSGGMESSAARPGPSDSSGGAPAARADELLADLVLAERKPEEEGQDRESANASSDQDVLLKVQSDTSAPKEQRSANDQGWAVSGAESLESATTQKAFSPLYLPVSSSGTAVSKEMGGLNERAALSALPFFPKDMQGQSGGLFVEDLQVQSEDSRNATPEPTPEEHSSSNALSSYTNVQNPKSPTSPS